MNVRDLPDLLLDAGKALGIAILGVICIPRLIGVFTGVPLERVLGLIGSVLILQTVATALGMGLDITPPAIFLIMISIAVSVISVIYAILALCDAFAQRSPFLSRFIARMDELTKKSRSFKKYGMVMLVPFIWLPGAGLYGCALIAWLFRWRGARVIMLMLTGWLVAVTVVMLATLNIIMLLG